MLNAKQPRFNARWRNPQCEDVDRLHLPDAVWCRESNYYNPPWTALMTLAAKLRQSGEAATVVAPNWPSKPRYQDLKRLASHTVHSLAEDFLASSTRWALHKETLVDRDATRLQGESPKVQPLVVDIVMSRLARCDDIARIGTVATDHMGPVQRYVFTKDGIERAIHTTRVGLKTTLDYSLLSLDMENAFNAISRRIFLAEVFNFLTCIMLSRWLR
jgi:hypothetical protein